MNLKNYTSNVPFERTISLIEAYLAECGVTGITKQYEDKLPVAVFFHIDLGAAGRFTIRLPARVKEVQDYLWRDYAASVRRPRKVKEDFAAQAVMTAWKLQQDWVQVQMSLIRLKQVDFLQVFMGFIWTGQQTYYDQVKESGLKLLVDKKIRVKSPMKSYTISIDGHPAGTLCCLNGPQLKQRNPCGYNMR